MTYQPTLFAAYNQGVARARHAYRTDPLCWTRHLDAAQAVGAARREQYAAARLSTSRLKRGTM